MQIRWQNFKSFKDTQWLDIRPLTVILGNNGSGKTTILQPLLLLKQTLSQADESIALLTQGDYANLGTYLDLIKNHDINKTLSLGIRLKDCLELSNQNPDPLPPNEVILKFEHDKDNMPRLLEFNVNDCTQRSMLKRTRERNGQYDFNVYDKRTISIDDQDLRRLVLEQKPYSCFFTEDSIMRYIITKNAKSISRQEKSIDDLSTSQNIGNYISILSYINTRFKELFRSVKYIGPIRDYPKRIYEYRGESHDDIGSRGQHLYSILNAISNGKERKELSSWLKLFKLAEDVTCRRLKDRTDLMEITVRPLHSNLWLNFADTCFGVSQVLPLIAQCIIAKKNETIICEQPEIHLNPECELLLGDFFVDCANEKRANYVIESHSEHMILRIRKLIRMKKIDCKKVIFYYTNIDDNDGSIIKLDLDQDGNFVSNNWPAGFFEQSLSENMSFVSLKAK